MAGLGDSESRWVGTQSALRRWAGARQEPVRSSASRHGCGRPCLGLRGNPGQWGWGAPRAETWPRSWSCSREDGGLRHNPSSERQDRGDLARGGWTWGGGDAGYVWAESAGSGRSCGCGGQIPFPWEHGSAARLRTASLSVSVLAFLYVLRAVTPAFLCSTVTLSRLCQELPSLITGCYSVSNAFVQTLEEAVAGTSQEFIYWCRSLEVLDGRERSRSGIRDIKISRIVQDTFLCSLLFRISVDGMAYPREGAGKFFIFCLSEALLVADT